MPYSLARTRWTVPLAIPSAHQSRYVLCRATACKLSCRIAHANLVADATMLKKNPPRCLGYGGSGGQGLAQSPHPRHRGGLLPCWPLRHLLLSDAGNSNYTRKFQFEKGRCSQQAALCRAVPQSGSPPCPGLSPRELPRAARSTPTQFPRQANARPAVRILLCGPCRATQVSGCLSALVAPEAPP